MIIKLNQKRSDIKFEYEFIHNGNIVCTSFIPIKLVGREIHFADNHGQIYKIESCFPDDLKRVLNNYPVYKSYSIKGGDGKECGCISVKKSSFWLGQFYYEVMLKGNFYSVYEVGRGAEGLFLTVYQGEKQVALIEKDIMVRDYKDTYTIYLKNEVDKTPVMLFNVFYDAIRWSNKGKYGCKVKECDYVYTINKFIKSSYNPAFKSGIAD